MKKIFLLQTLAILSLAVFAQTDVPFLGKIKWINGFAKEISGENISYFSAFPDYATVALLTRTTDGKKTIEWETAPVPKNVKGPYVYFSWVAAHSTGTSGGIRNFDLYVNDEKLLTFSTYPKNEHPNWTYGADDSSRIVFQQTKMDGAKDAHGLAYLRLPMGRITLGQPVRIKVIGQNQNSNDWYMTFKFSFEEKVDINPMPFILKNGNQPIVLTSLHFGNPQKLVVKINNKETFSFTTINGVNNFDIPVTAVSKPDSMLVQVFLSGKLLTNKYVQLKPVVYRTFYFIHHSHTDIGYSNLQPEVEKIHIKDIDDALHMIDETKDYPADARFKWNVESLWAVENFLKQASPEQKQKFVAAVKNGSICLSAMYANILTGMSEPEEVFHYNDYAKELEKKYGFTINSAMESDVPGFAWTTVTALAKAGVKYFSSGPNYLGETHPYLGDRVGYFVKKWGDKPVWLTSPSGEEKILFWTAAKGYSSWHGTPPGGVFDRGPKKIAEYLNELANENYPYNMVQWRYNIVSDNGPIDTSISRFVKMWNEKYASPKIILSTTEKMFEDFEKKYGSSIPIVKGDITPYWEDGAQSTAEEEGQNRVNSLRLQQLQTLYSMLNPKQYDAQKFYEAWRNIIMFHEHTWGAYNSISEPDVPFVTEQWRIKKQFMLDGDKEVNQLETVLLQPITDLQSKTIAVFNTSSYERSGPVILPPNTIGKSVKDFSGKAYPLQKLSNGNFVFIAENVPALGNAVYELSNETADVTNPFTVTDSTLNNGKMSLAWNANNGSITSINTVDNFNYAGKFNQQGLNSYWYVPGLNPADAETNSKVKISIDESGPVVTTISIQSDAPGTNGLDRKISLYANDDKIIIENTIDKKAVRSKESVHFGFPFDSTFRYTTVDAGYGTMKYLGDQLPGSNMDYLYGRRWLDASSANKGMQLLWLQTPLTEPENMIDERKTINQSHKEWKTKGEFTSTWFSYAMNNYWHTNYKADQEGISKYDYALRPHGTANNAEMEQVAAEYTQPLIAIPVKENSIKPGSLFELSNHRISVVCITPDAEGNFIVRLFNPEPAALTTNFIWKELNPAQIINLKPGEIINPDKAINIAGMDVVEIKLIKGSY